MSKNIVLQLVVENDIDFIIEKLRENKLPTEDIIYKIKSLYIVEECDKKIGIVGLEVLDEFGLMRSLCVIDSALRNKGYGRKMVSLIIELSKSKKIKELYLLTTTAEQFFSKLNFIKINRNEVPEKIKQIEEFNSLCPSIAVCMKILIA